jgi:hypothetical protein
MAATSTNRAGKVVDPELLPSEIRPSSSGLAERLERAPVELGQLVEEEALHSERRVTSPGRNRLPPPTKPLRS